MEVTARRLAGLVFGAFVLLLLAQPPHPVGTPWNARRRDLRESERVVRIRSATLDTLRALNQSLWLRRIRDSVSHVLAATPANARSQFFADPRIPPSLRQHFQQVYAQTRGQMGGDWSLPMFLVVDSIPLDGQTTTLWLDDAGLGPHTCATVVRIYLARDRVAADRQFSTTLVRAFGGSFPQRRDFGLCSFEAAYGAPSPAVRRWLRERAFYPINRGLTVAAPPRPNAFVNEDGLATDPMWITWWRGGENGLRMVALRACAAGRTEFCAEAAAPQPDMPVPNGVDIASNWTQGNYWWGWRGTPELMNGLAQALGPQKFGELWRADATPFESYRRLTGVAVDTLARRLLVGDRPIRLGTAPTLREAIAMLLLAALFAALALRPHPRRQH